MIVAHDVVNVGHDRTQLASMAVQAKDATGAESLEVIADRGYHKGPELLACEQAGITPSVPRTMTSDNKAQGLYDKRDFIYLAEADAYRCPAGEQMNYRHTSIEDGLNIKTCYNGQACANCQIKAKCTTTKKERRVRRWEHEDVLDAMHRRLEQHPGKMRLRRCTVEHVFGTLKFWMGSTHFLMKTRERVGTEMSLHVLSYNLRRAINILGINETLSAIRHRAA